MDEPLKPIWQVVHRDVLIELLRGHRIMTCGFHDPDNRCEVVKQLWEQAEAGTLPVLTRELWEGME